MENQNNNEYGQTDPDFIDQNTLIDGNFIQNENQYKKDLNKDQKTEFGETDPDYLDQNTPVDHDNYARPEDPYEHTEGFVENLTNPEENLENNENPESKNTLNQEQISNKNENSANDRERNDTENDN